MVPKHSHKLFPNSNNPGALFEAEFVLDQEATNHIRIAYSLMDVLGDIAGLFELFVTIFGIIFLSISKHSMTLNTIKKLFMVKTADKQLFNQKNKDLLKDKGAKGIKKYIRSSFVQQLANRLKG